jgi:hypothetical protein
VRVVELVGELEFTTQTLELRLMPGALVEHFQRDRTIGAGGVMGLVHRRGPTVAEHRFDDISLEPVAGRKHPHSLWLARAFTWRDGSLRPSF